MSNTKQIVSMFLILGIVLVIACGPKATPPSAAVPATVSRDSAKSAGQMDWEKTLETAKREGTLLVYTGAGPVVSDALYKGFLERYGIKTVSISGTVGELMQKVVRERGAGLFVGDLSMTTGVSTIYAVLKPRGMLEKLDPILVMPEVLDSKAWRTGELRWLDPDHVAVAGITYVSPPIVINTTQVQDEELLSYIDLLNPKWQGKIAMFDPTIEGQGLTLWATIGSKITGWDFVQEFVAKQQPVLFRDIRLGVEWVARGKYPIGMALSPGIVSEFKQVGSPLKYVIPKEGAHASSSWGLISVLTQAPHPNAAKVFANWFLSKEGQTITAKSSGLSSARLDVPVEGIDPAVILQPGVKYIFNDTEQFTIEMAAYKEKAKEIFARANK